MTNDSTIHITRGDTAYFTVEIIDENGNKLYLETGDTIYITVKRSTKDTEKLIQKVITTFDDGSAIIKIEPNDTKLLDYATYVYDVQWTKINGDVVTIIKPNAFVIGSEVTYE